MNAPPDASTPVFLLSMPRSGSTMLQRMLATHPSIATGPEPTFLLPLILSAARNEIFATFDQRFTADAIEDFFASASGGDAAFDATVRAAAAEAYRYAAGTDAQYFLDKTPKYHLVADDLIRIFPSAPIIVLWRNPLSVIASLMSTWGGGGGRWNLHHFRLDLYRGLPNLIDAVRRHPERCRTVRYEDLVADPNGTLAGLFGLLGLDPSLAGIDRFGEIDLPGRIQDPNVGTDAFARVRTDRVEQWGTILANPVRRAWCRRYLRWLGADRIAAMGYDLDILLDELDGLPRSARFLASDTLLVPYDVAYRTLQLGVVAARLRSIRRREFPLLPHK